MVLGEPVYKATGTTAWVSAFREEILAAHDHALPRHMPKATAKQCLFNI